MGLEEATPIKQRSVLDDVRVRIAGFFLGEKLWRRIYRTNMGWAWQLGKEGRELPWNRPDDALRTAGR